jgi:hypothetical protein
MADPIPCPHCTAPLIVIGSGWHCQSCGRDYIDERVPINGCTRKEYSASLDRDTRIGKSFGRFWSPT